MPTYKYVVGLSWSGAGSPGVNVWHLRTVSSGPLNNDLEQCVTAIKTFYEAIDGSLAPGVTVTGPAEAIKDPYGSPEYEAVTSWSTTGSGTNGFAPLASAICVGWRTTSATRSGRGRTFLSPLAGYCVDSDGTPKSDVMAQVRNAATALVASSEGFDNGAIGIYSQSDGVLRDIVSSQVRDTFAVLRSRRD